MSIRDWLDKNKVFFETITAVLLAVMAIVVSLEANRIASYQTELMRLEHQQFCILILILPLILSKASTLMTDWLSPM